MTDDLIARLLWPRTEQGGLWPMPNLHDEAADALEAKDARIAELKSALKDAAELLFDAYADIGRSEYGLGYSDARAALEKKND